MVRDQIQEDWWPIYSEYTCVLHEQYFTLSTLRRTKLDFPFEVISIYPKCIFIWVYCNFSFSVGLQIVVMWTSLRDALILWASVKFSWFGRCRRCWDGRGVSVQRQVGEMEQPPPFHHRLMFWTLEKNMVRACLRHIFLLNRPKVFIIISNPRDIEIDHYRIRVHPV